MRAIPSLATMGAVIGLVFSLVTPAAAAPSSRIAPRLASVLGGAHPDIAAPTGEIAVWVFFTDKGTSPATIAGQLRQARTALSRKALERRSKMGGTLVDESDLPVNPTYIQQIEATGARLREQSRWLNAASFEATLEQIRAITSYGWVDRLDVVARATRPLAPEPFSDPAESALPPAAGRAILDHTYDYGASVDQMGLANVPAAHDQGWTGAGVTIGILDSGFRTTHAALSHLNIVAAYDFVNDDPIVDNEVGDPAAAFEHGSRVLSVAGAFSEGNLVGPAFNADYILAKTEDIADEQIIEEDWWVAGLEWVEAQGADLVSTSLGYYYWYNWEDMDGDTAITTIAADAAAQRGLLVVTSAGNERGGDWDHMTAPADGHDVLAVGATYANGIYAYFSSPGPTYDGRIKPDVMAMGRSNIIIQTLDDTTFSSASGTSFAAPLVAGVVALVLEKYPTLTPQQLIEAMRETGARAANPDNDYGWGMIDAMAALDYYGPKFIHAPLHDTEDTTGPYVVAGEIQSASPVVPGTAQMYYRTGGGAFIPVGIVGSTFSVEIPGQPLGTTVEYYFEATDELGITKTFPANAPSELLSFRVEIDATAPTVTHVALPDWPERQWPPVVQANAADNVFVSGVTVEWSVNGNAGAPFPLVDETGGTWAAGFPDSGNVPVAGDSISYLITVSDAGTVPNTTIDGPHAFRVTDDLARVLLVDDSPAGLGAGLMAGWMDALGYAYSVIGQVDFPNQQMHHWQCTIISTDDELEPLLAQNAPALAALTEYADAGGSIFLQGGNFGVEAQFYSPAFAEDVLHLQTFFGGNAGYLVQVPEQSGHPVATTPNLLNSTLAQYSGGGGDQDSFSPTRDADMLYRTFSYPGAAGIIAFDRSASPQRGHYVALLNNINKMTTAANMPGFFENAMLWLTTPEPTPDASVSGTIDLAGMPDDSGVTVSAGRFYSTTTASDGSYSIPDMFAGTHELRISREGFETVLTEITLASAEDRTGVDFQLRMTDELRLEHTTAIVIPPSDPLGTTSTINVGPEHAGKVLADIQVTVDVTHQNSGDLTLKLTSPEGTVVTMHNRSGGEAADIVGTWPTTLVVDGPGSLDDMIGESIVGDWQLFVSDSVVLVNGTVDYWALRLSTPVDPPTAAPALPSTTRLYPNVPNPFNPVTQIRFDLAQPGPARLVVYDLRGRRVRTLVNETLGAGQRVAIWNGRDDHGHSVASGVYVYRLEAGGHTFQQKLTLLK